MYFVDTVHHVFLYIIAKLSIRKPGSSSDIISTEDPGFTDPKLCNNKIT